MPPRIPPSPTVRPPLTNTITTTTTTSTSRVTKPQNHDPLSPDAMDAFRCPTRVDFLNAASFGDPVDSLVAFQPRTSFAPRVASLRTRHNSLSSSYTLSSSSTLSTNPSSTSITRTRSKSRPLRTSRLTDEDRQDINKNGNRPSHHLDIQRKHSVTNSAISSTSTKNHYHDYRKYSYDDYPYQLPPASHTDSEDEDNCVPQELMYSLLDAMDQVSADSELRAISQWLDRLRTRNKCQIRLTDADLSNGVALLDALIIAGAVDQDHQSVNRQPDIDGVVAKKNINIIRKSLTSFPWRSPPPIALIEIDVWRLPRYVLLAAVSCDAADDLVADMMLCDEWVQRRLSETVAQGMKDMGLATSEEQEREQIERLEQLEQRVTAETDRAEKAEADVVRLESAIDGWRATCEALEETVQTLTARLELAQKEVKRLKDREKDRERDKKRVRERDDSIVSTGGVVLKERNRSAAAASAARSSSRSVPSSPVRSTSSIHRKDSRLDDSRSRRKGDSTR